MDSQELAHQKIKVEEINEGLYHYSLAMAVIAAHFSGKLRIFPSILWQLAVANFLFVGDVKYPAPTLNPASSGKKTPTTHDENGDPTHLLGRSDPSFSVERFFRHQACVPLLDLFRRGNLVLSSF